MTESWAIAVMTVGFGALTALLAWMGGTLWGIHRDLRGFVAKEDCRREMDGHCGEIDALWRKVRDGERELAALRQIAEIYHRVNGKQQIR